MIEYRGTPLFGEGSSVSHTSEFFAITGTVLFWILFLIFSFVIKPQPKKPEYKEVQIVLSSTPVVQKTEEAPAPSEAASAGASESGQSETSESVVNAETPVREVAEVQPVVDTAPAQTPKTQPQSKPAAKPTPAPQQTVSEPIKYAIDPMEAFVAQTAKKPKQEFDWSKFDDEEIEEDTKSIPEKTVQNTEPAFSGSAGSAVENDSAKITSISQNKNSKSDTVSDSTLDSLDGIKKTTFLGNAPKGVQSETSVKSRASSSGNMQIEMSDGKTRILIDPKEPRIDIPPSLYHLIDSSRKVTISFKVLNLGNVTDVIISPESSLHSDIRQEITRQLSLWRFDSADYTATATFEYKIVKQ